MEQTWTEAVETLRSMIENEDAVLIDDGVQKWEIAALVEACRGDENGVVADLVVEPTGITRIQPDGFRESVHAVRVVPRPYTWELLRNGHEVIATMEQDAEDFETNGRGYMLDAIIPDEHADAAQEGEWDEVGFNYSYGDDQYLVQYYRN